VDFFKRGVEDTGFKDEFFDVIVFNEVIEHLKKESVALDELYRILKPKGTLILTTPHKGLFSFMDTDNYVYFIRTRFPMLYKKFYRMRFRKQHERIKPGYDIPHKHYSFRDLKKILDCSAFGKNYKIKKMFRSGLLLGPLYNNLKLIFSVLPGKKITTSLIRPIKWLSDIDFWVPYGPFSYFIALKIKKIK
jgi:predicted SAM-dependent methyltransferase